MDEPSHVPSDEGQPAPEPQPGGQSEREAAAGAEVPGGGGEAAAPATPEELRAEIERNVEAGEWELVVEDLLDLAGMEAALDDKVAHLTRAARIFGMELEDAQGAAAIRLEAARLLADAERFDEATEQIELILEADPTHEEALEELEALAAEREDWDALFAAYDRRLVYVEDAEGSKDEQLTLLRRMSLIQREALQDFDGAVGNLRRMLELDPTHEEAAAQLEELYRARERWADLAAFYVDRADLLEAGEGRAAVLCKAAAVQRDELGAPTEAAVLYREVLEVAPGHPEAVAGLRGHYEATEDWAALERLLLGEAERLETAGAEAAERLAAWTELGLLRTRRLGDGDGAIAAYERALALDSSHMPAIDGLAEAFEAAEKWELYSKVLALKLSATPREDEVARAALHHQLALVLRDRLGEVEEALGHFERSIELDPTRYEPRAELGLTLVAKEAWPEGLALLESAVVRLPHDVPDARRAKIWRALGRAAEEVFDEERARSAYREVLASATPDADLLWRLAKISMRLERYEEAQDLFQRLKVGYRDALTAAQRAELAVDLGQCAVELGQLALAKDVVAELDGDVAPDAAALKRLVEVARRSEDWAKVVATLKRLAEVEEEPLARFRALLEAGDVCRDRLGDRAGAAEAYRAALTHGAHSKAPLVNLLQLHVEERDFEAAIDVLEQLAERETNTERKARWIMSIGQIYQDELKRPARAIHEYERVLDVDPNQLEAFQAVDSLLTKAQDWKELERAYRRMIQRVQKAGDKVRKRSRLLFMLYRALGDIYQKRLPNDEYAIAAYELALDQKPDDLKVRLTLARLCVRVPAMLDKAVANYRWLLQAYPEQFEHYHKLSALYASAGEIDRAWCIAGILRLFGKALEAEERMYEKFLRPGLAPVKRGFDSDIWTNRVMGPRYDLALGQIFGVLYELLGDHLVNKSPKSLGVSKRQRLDLRHPSPFTETLYQVSQILGLGVQEVYYAPDQPGLRVLPTRPVSFAIGSNFANSDNIKGLGFHIAKKLVYLHPWHVLAAHYDEDLLHLLYMAAGAAVVADFPILLRDDLPADVRATHLQFVTGIRERLAERLTPETARKLLKLFNYVKDPTSPGVVRRWHQEVERTANHAAVFVVNDIHLVGVALKKEHRGTSSLTVADKLKDFAQYVLSDQFAKLRKVTGVAIPRR